MGTSFQATWQFRRVKKLRTPDLDLEAALWTSWAYPDRELGRRGDGKEQKLLSLFVSSTGPLFHSGRDGPFTHHYSCKLRD